MKSKESQLGEGQRGVDDVRQIADTIVGLVPALPERVFVQTANDGILEVKVTQTQEYDGQASYQGGGDKWKQPPAVNSHTVTVHTVDGQLRLSIKFTPAYTAVEYHEATPKNPRGNYPRQVDRFVEVKDGRGQSIMRENDGMAVAAVEQKDLNYIIAFLDNAVAQGLTDEARRASVREAHHESTRAAIRRLV